MQRVESLAALLFLSDEGDRGYFCSLPSTPSSYPLPNESSESPLVLACVPEIRCCHFLPRNAYPNLLLKCIYEISFQIKNRSNP